PHLPSERCKVLDQILEPDPAIKSSTRLEWLRQGATTNSPRAILSSIEKLNYLRAQGVTGWDFDVLTHNRRKFLAQLGRKSSPEARKRSKEQLRYPILLAFLVQTAEDLVDEIVEIY